MNTKQFQVLCGMFALPTLQKHFKEILDHLVNWIRGIDKKLHISQISANTQLGHNWNNMNCIGYYTEIRDQHYFNLVHSDEMIKCNQLKIEWIAMKIRIRMWLSYVDTKYSIPLNVHISTATTNVQLKQWRVNFFYRFN